MIWLRLIFNLNLHLFKNYQQKLLMCLSQILNETYFKKNEFSPHIWAWHTNNK